MTYEVNGMGRNNMIVMKWDQKTKQSDQMSNKLMSENTKNIADVRFWLNERIADYRITDKENAPRGQI